VGSGHSPTDRAQYAPHDNVGVGAMPGSPLALTSASGAGSPMSVGDTLLGRSPTGHRAATLPPLQATAGSAGMVGTGDLTLTASDGTVQRALVAGRDYLPWPLNGLPITGLTLVSGTWPDNPGGVSVVLARGYALTLPPSVRDAAIEETLRTLRRAQAGIDDRSGTAPFGQEATSPALLAATARKLYKFRLGSGMLRRAG
jgi:hypothetical protein